ncbi:ABC transporter permease [Rhizobium sp. C1]|uniref:ABC transporter permease n=1 Tax=Rhizobium sp. C1 TaxID=1349799 RepID=UPI001E4BF17C|nr:ABC transporter permease [Rhizobium sp. C1]MCD2177193.1 ABC transporter permease [Rhizobium sp. C1]
MSDMVSAILNVIDPFCGPVGVFTLFAGKGILSCGDTGWGDKLASGVYVTASLALLTLPFGLLLGFLVALGKRSDDAYARLAANIYTTIFRGLPELLTLFIVYYGLQILIEKGLTAAGMNERFEINAFFAGMIALSVVFSAYCSEVLLSAFQAIPRGQYEAGAALGIRPAKTMVLVIIPQLVRIALPGLGNLWMSLLKDTALVSVIGLSDILRETGVAAKSTKEPFLFFGIACLLFLLLAIISSFFFSRIEIWARRSEAAR